VLDSFKKRRAKAQNEAGIRHAEQGNRPAARAAYESALKLDPDLSPAWFNLGLIHKELRNWDEVIRCNRRSIELTGETTNNPAWWNLGIGATALRHWETAREAWRAYGVAIPDGEGPIEENLGLAPIRIDPEGNAEVVWATRIDPARAVIRSVPLPDTGRRWGDCILHDGVPRGERMYKGQPRAVFDELEVWESSGVPTLVARVECASFEDSDELSRIFFQADLAAEDWTKDVRALCQACSEGLVDIPHNHEGEAEWSLERRFGFAAKEEEASRWTAEWTSVSPANRRVLTVQRAL
jgi:tetratricopeptide (TPR) repeat protein